MTIDGILTNTSQPLIGLDKRTAWVANESVAYGNLAPDRRAQLLAITKACSGDDILAKIYTVSHQTNAKICYFNTSQYMSMAWHIN